MLGMLLQSFRHLEHQNPSVFFHYYRQKYQISQISHIEVIGVRNITIDLDSHHQISHSRMKSFL